VVRKLESYLAEKARIQQDDSDLTSRSDLRKDRLKSEGHIKALAIRLCETSDKRVAKLGLADALLELIAAARRIESLPARDRAHRRIRRELRDIDIADIERQLDAFESPGHAPKSPELVWAERLFSGGESAIDALLSECASADRGQIRTLLRNAVRAKEADRARAKKKLMLAIREALALSGRTAKANDTLDADSVSDSNDTDDDDSEASQVELD
jgi:ribosomal 50S subunit-associated protein YjgA (DUF615 family)